MDERSQKALRDAVRVIQVINQRREDWCTARYMFEVIGKNSINPSMLEAVHQTYAKLMSECIGDTSPVEGWLREYADIVEKNTDVQA